MQNILAASLYGSIIIAVILLLRPLMKAVPRKYLCLLWLLAFVRLLLPFQINAPFSLQPDLDVLMPPREIPVTQAEPIPAVPEDAVLPEDVTVVYGDAFTPPESIPEGLEGYYPPVIPEETHRVIDWNSISLGVWGAVAAAFVAYSIFTYLRLKARVREAVRSGDGSWECAGLDTAFILGWLRPRVYLPTGLSPDTRHHILRHERTHLKRLDHWMKLLGFLALTVHWFNPLVWVAWVLLCRDMELACDEQVVKDMGLEERKDYSAALLRCSTQKEHYLVCPVAFGEVSVKTRILSVLNYRKPRFWISLVGILAIAFVAVFLLTSPKEEEPLRAGYTGPNDPYEYYHATEREQNWEEDILYLAKMMLGKQPRLYDGEVTIYHGLEYNNKEFSNAMFDAEIRQAFIDGIDALIPRLAQLSDEQIPFEINRVMALTGDDGSVLHIGWPVIQLPICVEPIWNGENVSYHLVGLPAEYENFMFGELTAINGISIADIAERLEPCVAYRNEQWAIRWLTGVDYFSYLQTRGALETAGVVKTGAESAELTIQTDTGTYSVTLPFQKSEKWGKPGYVFEHLYATDLPPYRYIERKNIWSETLEDAIYLQITNMPHGTNEVDQELVKVFHSLQNAEKPVKLIIDLRIGAYGNSVRDRFKSFAGRVNSMETDGVYILIDSLSQCHAPTTAFLLKQWIEGAVLVGTPTGQSINSFTYSENYWLPNNGLYFHVTEKYDYLDESLGEAVLQPDILVQQTLEDYKNGVDTVFQYVMDME